ncbi:MAG: DNA primase [Weeksellaceae bacterium]
MNQNIDEVKQRIDIVEYISRVVQLKKSGRNFKGLCPFHQEKSPSFVVSADRQIWRCFGTCGTGGDVIAFLMKRDNITFVEALHDLAKEAGVSLDTTAFEDKQWNIKETIYKMNLLAAKYYAYILTETKVGEKGREYLKGRGINDKIAKTFELGYGPDSWDSLLKFLLKKGFKEADIIESGLVVVGNSNNVYDRFRNRLVFPIKDAKDNIIGFSGRLLGANEKQAKYVNTPETPVYKKRESLYGIHLAKDAIRKLNVAYIVEGEFDMIHPYQQGVDNIVAIKGAAFTKEQLQLLKRYTDKIVLALDTDEAGIEAMKRGITEAEKMDFDVHVAQFTSGKDPDEALKNDPVAFKKDLNSAIPIYDFLIQIEVKKHDPKNPFEKKKIAEALAPFFSFMQNPIIKSHYHKQLANILEVDEQSVEKLMRYKKQQRAGSIKMATPTVKTTREENDQKYVLSYLMQRAESGSSVLRLLMCINLEDIIHPAMQKVYSAFTDWVKSHETFVYQEFMDSLPNELHSTTDELYLYATVNDDIEDSDMIDVIMRLKKFAYLHYSNQSLQDNNDEKYRYWNGLLQKLDRSNVEKSLLTV